MTSVSGSNNGSSHTSQSDLARGLPLMPPEQQPSDSLPDLDRSPVLQPPKTDVQVLNVPSNSHQVLEGAPVGQRADRGLRSRVYERSPSASARSISATPSSEQYEEARQVILSSFAPRVACFASRDTEDFVALKGFRDGLCGLLRAFGEHIQGKVVIRDSVGASKGWEDFGIRFINPSSLQYPHRLDSSIQLGNSLQSVDPQQSSQSDDIATAIDQILEYRFGSEKELLESTRSSIIHSDYTTKKSSHFKQSVYLLYLRKLLATMPIVPHETFSHPVTCIIAVSSHNSAPIDSLHQLYEDSCHGEGNIPAWINTKDYLRYYVLIHDEENDDITKSTALFDQMKRHFGLHCHLLRLQSSQSVQTDDDSVQVPRCEWLSAEEELDLIRKKGMIELFFALLLSRLP